MRHRLAILGLLASTSLVACSSSSNTGSTGSNQNTDGGGNGGYVPPTGDPVTAPDKTWTWVPVDGAKCRDGSPTGFAINMSSGSDKVMLFFMGGGACYNQATCGATPETFDSTSVSNLKGGMLDRDKATNPVKDWNMIYFPFCTGDVFGGSKENVTIPGVAQPQQFVGYKNIGLFLDRIVPTFPHPSQVLSAGFSAGGFGAGVTSQLIANKFPPGTNVTLIDDSGPPMDKQYLESCLQTGWNDTWGFEDTFLKDCGADCPDHTNFSLDWALHLTKMFPNAKSGLIDTTDDSIITLFYGFGVNNCAAPGSTFPAPMAAADYKAGLLDTRAKLMAKTQNFGTYYIEGTQHTWIETDSFYTEKVGTESMVDWATNIVNGTSADQVGP
jgi:hypothetical protein